MADTTGTGGGNASQPCRRRAIYAKRAEQQRAALAAAGAIDLVATAHQAAGNFIGAQDTAAWGDALFGGGTPPAEQAKADRAARRAAAGRGKNKG